MDASGRVLAVTPPATPLRSAFATVASTAATEMSMASTYGAPRRAATTPARRSRSRRRARLRPATTLAQQAQG